jgi:hypothetical protein
MKLFGLTLVTALAVITGVSAQQTTIPPPNAATIMDGKWDLTLATDQGPISLQATFKLDGTKLSGSITSPDGTTSLDGQFVDGKMTFTIRPDGGAIDFIFTGAMKDDGGLTGTLAGPLGQQDWTATHAKGL